MKKQNLILLAGLCLTLSGCSASTGSAWTLGVLGVVVLVLGGLRTYNHILYCRRKQRRGREKAAPRLDNLTLGLLAGGVVLLILALLVGCLSGGDPEQSGGSGPDTAQTGGTSSTPETTVDPYGWQESTDGRRYYLLEDGSFVTGWMEEGSRIYYFDESGMTLLGWNELDGIMRYFREDGSMARGEEVIDGKTCFFTSTGAQVIMVNPWNAIPEDYQVELVDLSVIYATEGVQVSGRIYDALIEMMDACNENSGSRCCVVSGYRTHEYQSNAYEKLVTRLMNEGKTEEEARKEAATRIATPGNSEHQLGMAVDIVDTQLWSLVQEQENLAAQKWLMEHCYDYGFILRYPDGATESTGIIYEPWHYRYVGLELAQELKGTGLTLEQYLDGLD